jgi:hypothetical protein
MNDSCLGIGHRLECLKYCVLATRFDSVIMCKEGFVLSPWTQKLQHNILSLGHLNLIALYVLFRTPFGEHLSPLPPPNSPASLLLMRETSVIRNVFEKLKVKR